MNPVRRAIYTGSTELIFLVNNLQSYSITEYLPRHGHSHNHAWHLQQEAGASSSGRQWLPFAISMLSWQSSWPPKASSNWIFKPDIIHSAGESPPLIHQYRLLKMTKAQFVRHCHTPKDWPPNPANRAHDIEDISQDNYDKTTNAIPRKRSGGRTFGDGHDEVEDRKELDNMMHRIKIVMKEAELVMDNMDKSRKKEVNNIVKMVDDVQKEIARERILDDGDGAMRGDDLENAMGELEAVNEDGDLIDRDGRDELEDEDNNEDIGNEPDDLMDRLAALENKVDVLEMDFYKFRSQAKADSTLKSMEKMIRLVEKLPRD